MMNWTIDMEFLQQLDSQEDKEFVVILYGDFPKQKLKLCEINVKINIYKIFNNTRQYE